MLLLWSDRFIRDAIDVERTAKRVEIRPLQFRVVPDDKVIIHPLANGRTNDNNIGWTERIDMTISEDQFSLVTEIEGVRTYVRDLVFGWERARYKWIKHPRLNNGKILMVSFFEKPERSHPGDYDFLHETSYSLQGQVFHKNLNTV